ncbi:tRNA(Ile)-lysidine synthetase [Candidatus Hodgkinia cicadicola]|nr:tRNA(Ile)-lysidine synthetase [Candidatus Hodgkinia cicadicola]
MITLTSAVHVGIARTSVRYTLALSGGGDSIGALFCIFQLLPSVNNIFIDHNLRYESARELQVRRIVSCKLSDFGGSANLRRCRILALIKLVCKFGGWCVRTAHTLLDNTEHVFGRQASFSAYSLCIPSFRWVSETSLDKPWGALFLRPHALTRYVNDISNADASNLRALWHQLGELALARVRWSVFASARLASMPC